MLCRSLWGERGLKFLNNLKLFLLSRRSLWGERGLKLFLVQWLQIYVSRSLWGERGLKYTVYDYPYNVIKSLPVRGAWIEIVTKTQSLESVRVAPCEGSVDWNPDTAVSYNVLQVAPCEGSVDWNILGSLNGWRTKGRSLWGERGLK